MNEITEKLLLLYPQFNTVHGPYKRKDGRSHAILYNNKTFKRKTISWPKALVEVREGRRLTDNETVDHNNRDFTDNSSENLIIRIRNEHCSLDVLRLLRPKANCVWCNKEITLTIDQIKSRAKSGPFCSRACSGAYGSSVQKGNGVLKRITIKRVYYNKVK
jgi:hypothetical protein